MIAINKTIFVELVYWFAIMRTVIASNNFVSLFSSNKMFLFCDDMKESSLKTSFKGSLALRGYNLEWRYGGQRK